MGWGWDGALGLGLGLRLPGEELEDLLVPATLAVAGELEHLLLAELLGRLLEDGENEVLVLAEG